MREVRDRPTDYWLGGDEREARGALKRCPERHRSTPLYAQAYYHNVCVIRGYIWQAIHLVKSLMLAGM